MWLLAILLVLLVAAAIIAMRVRAKRARGLAAFPPKSGPADCFLSLPFQVINVTADLLGLNIFKWKPSHFLSGLTEELAEEHLGEGSWQALNRGAEVMCKAVNQPDSLVTPTGRVVARFFIQTVTANRDKLIKYFAANPAVQDLPIRKPLIVLGMPRTGSTLLYNLLACDPTVRVLRNWEQFEPLPPPQGGAAFFSDPRIAAVSKQQAKSNLVMPEFERSLNRIHYYDASAVEEEFILLCGCLVLFAHCMLLGDGEYEDWLCEEEDKEFVYRFLLLAMKVMVANYGEYSNWVLKTPLHSYYPNQLMDTMPSDACYIVTHRDPANVVPSCCKLVLFSMAIYMDEHRWAKPDAALNAKTLAKTALKHLGMTTRRVEEARAKHPEAKVTDVYYAEFIADPIATVRQIYAKNDYEYTEEFEANMRAYMEKNRQYKHGRVGYSLEEFGLTSQEVDEEFASYLQQHPRVRP